VTSLAPASIVASSSESSPADEGANWSWQVRVRDRLERREVRVAELEDGDRLRDVLEAVLPEIDQGVPLVEQGACCR
jgi:hypothetical protein